MSSARSARTGISVCGVSASILLAVENVRDGSWLLGVRYSFQKVSLPPSPDPDNVRAYAILAMLVGEIMYLAVKRFLPSRMLSFALLSI